MKKNRWKKGIALFLSIILAAGTGNGISVCDGDGDEHGSCII